MMVQKGSGSGVTSMMFRSNRRSSALSWHSPNKQTNKLIFQCVVVFHYYYFALSLFCLVFQADETWHVPCYEKNDSVILCIYIFILLSIVVTVDSNSTFLFFINIVCDENTQNTNNKQTKLERSKRYNNVIGTMLCLF